MRVASRRAAVGFVVDRFGLSERRSCALIGIDRASCRYVARRPSDEPLRARLIELAKQRPRWGYRTLWEVLRRERVANHKKVHRLHKLEGLQVRRRRRKQAKSVQRVPLTPAQRPNERWSMDFTSDTLANGRSFRTLNIVDDCTRECPAIEVGLLGESWLRRPRRRGRPPSSASAVAPTARRTLAAGQTAAGFVVRLPGRVEAALR